MLRLGVLLAMCMVTAAQDAPRWSETFEQCSTAQRNGAPDRALSLAEKGWQQVQEAGPKHALYRGGVRQAAREFDSLGRHLRANGVYKAALAAARDIPDLERDLGMLHAAFLAGGSYQVAAESAWESLLAAEEQREEKSFVYQGLLLALAYVKEEVGKLDVAEQLYRRALAARPMHEEDWLVSVGDAGVPNILRGSDARKALANFLADCGRFAEAHDVLRADAGEQYVKQRIWLHKVQANWEQAIALQRELIKRSPDQESLEERQSKLHDLLIESGQVKEEQADDTEQVVAAPGVGPPPDPSAQIRAALERGDLDRAKNLAAMELASGSADALMDNEFSQVANALQAAGRPAEARVILERYLSKAEETHGVGFPVAQHVLSECIRACATKDLADDGWRLLSRLESQVTMYAGAQSIEMESVLELRSNLLDVQGKEKDWANVQRQKMDLIASIHGPVSAAMQAQHRRLAERHAAAGQHEQARDEWLVALDMIRQLTGNYGDLLAQELVHAANYFKSQGWKEEAAGMIKEAESVAPPMVRKEILSRAQ